MSLSKEADARRQRIKRAELAGFAARRALYVYEQLKARGVYEYEARAAVLDAARDGLFGYINKSKRGK